MMEFQVVLLAGGTGTHLYPMTEGVTKCLLPVAGHPLIHYQLSLLQANGFKEVILCTSSDARQEIIAYIQQFPGLSVDLQIVDAEIETAEVLRAIKSRITKDFVVISGDLITDVKMYHLADVHRINDATCTILLRAPKKTPPQQGGKPAKPEGGPADFVALDETRSRLLYFKPCADVEDGISVPKRQLVQFPNMHVTKKMLDSHLYIFSRWVIDLLEADKELCSIKTELIPFLVNEAQFGTKPVPGQPQTAPSDLGDDSIVGAPPPTGNGDNALEGYVPLKCHALVLEDGYCARADTVRSFRDMNFEVPRHGHGDSVPWQKHPKSFEDKGDDERKALSKVVGSDCLVGSNFTIGEKSNVKKSIIGNHVTIGANCKVDQCIIFGHTSIEENTTMSGCIVGANCHVGKESTVTNCNMSARYTVEPESEHKNENLCLELED